MIDNDISSIYMVHFINGHFTITFIDSYETDLIKMIKNYLIILLGSKYIFDQKVPQAAYLKLKNQVPDELLKMIYQNEFGLHLTPIKIKKD